MSRTQNRLTIKSAFSILAIVALISTPSFAAPQSDVFSRPDDKKTEATDSQPGQKGSASKESSTQAPAITVKKESSAQIDQQSDGWFTIVDGVASTEIRLPGKPTYKEIQFSPIAGRPAVVNHLYNTLYKKQISVDYSWMDLHDAPQGKDLSAALDGAVKGAVVNVFGKIGTMTKIKSGKIPGREFDFTFPIQTPDGKTHMLSGKSRLFIQGKRQYQINVISPKGKEDKALITKLFDSLIINSL